MLSVCVKYVNNKSIHIRKSCNKLFTGAYKILISIKKHWKSSQLTSKKYAPFTITYTQALWLFNRYNLLLLPAIHSTYYYKNEKKIKKGTQ